MLIYVCILCLHILLQCQTIVRQHCWIPVSLIPFFALWQFPGVHHYICGELGKKFKWKCKMWILSDMVHFMPVCCKILLPSFMQFGVLLLPRKFPTTSFSASRRLSHISYHISLLSTNVAKRTGITFDATLARYFCCQQPS